MACWHHQIPTKSLCTEILNEKLMPVCTTYFLGPENTIYRSDI